MTGRAGHTRLGTRPSDRRGRRPDILGRGTCAHDAIGTRRICTRFFALATSSYQYLTGYCFWSHAGHVLVSNAPVPSASPDGELKQEGKEHPAKPARRWYAPDTANIRRATEIRPLSAPVGRWAASHCEGQRSGESGSGGGSCEARGRSPTMTDASIRHSERQRSPVRRTCRVCVSHRTKASPAQLAPCAENTAVSR